MLPTRLYLSFLRILIHKLAELWLYSIRFINIFVKTINNLYIYYQFSLRSLGLKVFEVQYIEGFKYSTGITEVLVLVNPKKSGLFLLYLKLIYYDPQLSSTLLLYNHIYFCIHFVHIVLKRFWVNIKKYKVNHGSSWPLITIQGFNDQSLNYETVHSWSL